MNPLKVQYEIQESSIMHTFKWKWSIYIEQPWVNGLDELLSTWPNLARSA